MKQAGVNAMKFDLLIKGGEIVGAPSGYSGRTDVAIERGKSAAVDRDNQFLSHDYQLEVRSPASSQARLRPRDQRQ